MAMSDALLRLDGIDGESIQSGHEKWMEVRSWSWGASNGGSSQIGSGSGSGKAVIRDFHFDIEYGISSPKLFLACCTGQHIATATLRVRKAGNSQQTFLEWKFTDILISSYRTSGSDVNAKNALPLDRVSFNFTQLEMEYRPQEKDGTLGAARKEGYNAKTGTKV